VRRAALSLALASALLPDLARAQETVQLWHAYVGAEEDALREVARRFEGETGTRVELLAVAFGAYGAKLESSIPTSRGPDLFIDAHERLPTYLRQQLVDPIGVEPEGFPESHLAPLRVEGDLYGLPLSIKCAALYLANDLAPSDPETLESLTQLSLPDDAYPLVMEAENGYYVAALLHAFGGRMLSEDGHYAFVGDEALETVGFLRRWQDAGHLPQETNGELVKRMFVRGRAAAAISGPWFAPDLPDDLDWRVVPLPTVAAAGEPMRPFSTIEGVYLAANADAVPQAQQLARYLASEHGALVRARTGRQIVSAEAAWPSLEDDAFLATFGRACAEATPMPAHRNMRLVFEPAQRALRKVLRAGEDHEDALAAGAHDFADVTRPLPPPTSPTPYVLGVGLLLLILILYWLKRAQDPAMKRAIRESLPAYKYLAHAALAVGLLVIAPILVGFGTSLYAGMGREELYFAGFANYADILSARGGEIFGHRSFYVVLGVTMLWTLLNLALHLGIGVALALLLHRKTLRFKAPYRVLLILPWAVPSYVTALAWKGMFHRQFGAINEILGAFGVEPVSWFAQWSTAFAANVTTNVWLGFPFMMVVTLGALTSIPQELYEAAAVDGATRWQRFRHVTMPMLVPSLAPAVAMGAVWTFNQFNVVFLVSAGEPDGTTEILISEAYRWAFTRSNQLGYASAYAVLIFGILLLTTRFAGKRLEASRA